MKMFTIEHNFNKKSFFNYATFDPQVIENSWVEPTRDKDGWDDAFLNETLTNNMSSRSTVVEILVNTPST